MTLGDIDARIVTALSLWTIGGLVWALTLRVWWTAPINRAFLFGPYLTPDGVRLVLRGWPMLFLLGAVAIAGGLGRFAYWLQARGAVSSELATVAGIVEAALSLWAAGTMVMFTGRTWLQWRRQR